MLEDSKRIATISEVTGSAISAIFNENVIENPSPETDRLGKVGTYVIMSGGTRSIIGSIAALRTIDAQATASPFGGGSGRHMMQIQLIGTVRDGRFERGLSTSPKLGSPVYAAAAEDISAIFSTFREHNFSLGTVSQLEEERF